MASDLNQVALIGRLTRDSEMRYSQGGMAIVSFSIAVNRSRKTADGRYQDEASFFDCTLFGKYGESMNQYLLKGKQVGISGSLKQETWQDQQSGQNRSKVVVLVNALQLLGDPRGQQGQDYAQGPPQGYQGQPQRPPQQGGYQSHPQQQRPPQAQQQGPESFVGDSYDQDIPF